MEPNNQASSPIYSINSNNNIIPVINRKKSRILVILLSVLLAGLGHIYLGYAKRGFQFIGLFILISLVLIFADLPSPILTLINLGSMGLWVFMILDVYNKSSLIESAQQNENIVSTQPAQVSSILSSIGFKKKEEYRQVVNEILQKDNIPEEQLIDFGICTNYPTYWLLIFGILWTMSIKNYIAILTTNRLILLKLDSVNKPMSYVFYQTNSLRCLKDSRFINIRNLTIQFSDGKKKVFSFANSGLARKNWGEYAEKIYQALSKT